MLRPGPWSALAAAVVLLAGGCAAPLAGSGATAAAGGAGGHAAGPATEDQAPSFTIEIVAATYGKLITTTLPGATCRVRATLPSGDLVLAGDFVVDQHADADGQTIWIYQTPVAGSGSGTGRYAITCASVGRTVSASADFDVH